MISATIEADDGLPLTLPGILRQRAAEHGDKAMLVCDDERLTYAEADTRSRTLARGLLAAGLGKGSHVAVLYPTGAAYVVAAFAAARIGAVIIPISTFSTADEVRWLLANADAQCLLSAQAFRSHNYEKLLHTALPELDLTRPAPLRSATAPMLRRIWLDRADMAGCHPSWLLSDLTAGAAAIDETLLEAVEKRVTPADRLVILHTSGSTSTPKGVIHTHGALIRHMHNLNQIRQYSSQDVLFTNSPLFWIAGFAYSLMATLLAGGRLVCSNAMAASDTLDLLERERPNMTNGYAQSVARLGADPSFARRDLSFMRRGNLYPIMPLSLRPRDPELRHGNYGMTEACSTLTSSGDEGDLPERYRGSFGTFAPGMEAKTVDPDTGRECAVGEIGELWIRGPFMMDGYYGRLRSSYLDRDGWFRTGDLGSIDAERFFYFKGRRGDMIKTLGANVSPKEVEAALRDLTGGRQCYVVGAPDKERGQVVVAVLIAESDSDVDEAALRQQLGQKVSSYKVPKRILRVAQADLPLMSSGKIDSRRLLALVVQRMTTA
jgi:acyl-CoA synthetase (AMP-forming)/AMP-acid ligase II